MTIFVSCLSYLSVIYCTSLCSQGTDQSEQATAGVVQAVSFYLFIHALKGQINQDKLPPASLKPVPFHPSIHTLKGRIDWNKLPTASERHSSLSHPILSPESYTLTLVY
jgi:hypothetical protein